MRANRNQKIWRRICDNRPRKTRHFSLRGIEIFERLRRRSSSAGQAPASGRDNRGFESRGGHFYFCRFVALATTRIARFYVGILLKISFVPPPPLAPLAPPAIARGARDSASYLLFTIYYLLFTIYYLLLLFTIYYLQYLYYYYRRFFGHQPV